MLRRARGVVLGFEGTAIIAHNFLRKTSAVVDGLDLATLALASDWVSREELVRQLGDESQRRIDLLQSAALLIAEGSAAARRDLEYETQWKWGAMAGYYHFGIQGSEYKTPDDAAQWLLAHSMSAPPVALHYTNDSLRPITLLPQPRRDSIYEIMRRRRSYRGFSPDPSARVPLAALRDCIHSGMGINGFIHSGIPGAAPLPLKMTPSGGARNPFEAYVAARAIEGLEPGLYHYCGLDNSLGRMSAKELPPFGELLAHQPWFDHAAALIILVAYFERTMWKYPHPTGFRVVLLEGGHIAQNILLAAR